MKEFWDERYKQNDYAYGKDPNEYLKEKLPILKPGKILFPAEGEGRNAVIHLDINFVFNYFFILQFI